MELDDDLMKLLIESSFEGKLCRLRQLSQILASWPLASGSRQRAHVFSLVSLDLVWNLWGKELAVIQKFEGILGGILLCMQANLKLRVERLATADALDREAFLLLAGTRSVGFVLPR